MNQLDFILGTKLTASGVIKAAPGTLRGLIIVTHSSGVIKLHNHASAASNSISTAGFTLATGERFLNLGDAFFTTGIYFELVSGTAEVIPVYK